MLLAASNGKELWYLTRGTGVVALLLLTAGTVLGVVGSTGWRSERWPRFVVNGLHRYLTMLAMLFIVIHVVTTVWDGFAPIGLLDAVVPFRSPYRPFWLGLGAVAFDLLLAIVVTSILRNRIGYRAWHAVHWFAYLSWPVAIMHALGTGSDARTSWLQLLAVGCTAAIAAAVLWRVWTAQGGAAPVRAGAGLAAFAVPLALLVWANSGPLSRDWAARSGTPSRLLTASVVATGSTTPRTTAAAPPLPTGAFSAPFKGQIVDSTLNSGLVVIKIDASAHGAFTGRVHVALRGNPIAGGGVQMIDNVVGLLPAGSDSWYSGTVVGLQGRRILTQVQTGNGATQRFLLDLQIDPNTGTVSGTIHGVAGQG
jgi:methionine sulfoxide reductase heme-binding subunit